MVKFTTKKIDSLTLGERMKKLRDERRISLSEISKGTKIQVKYLEYLEEGNYLKLPADVYVKGFLRSYAIFMGLSEASLIKQFEREKGIHKNIKKVVQEDNSTKRIDFSILVLTPKMLIISFVSLLVVFGFGYLYMEVNNFISNPRLVIISPLDGLNVDGSSTHLTGLAEKDALVFINDQPVMVNEDGEFSQDIGLKSGVNIINVRAKSKFDKESLQSVTINAQFESRVSESQSENFDQQNLDEQKVFSDPIALELYVNPNPTWMSVEADEKLVYSGVLLPGSIQKFEAKEKISITSGKGNETYVKINGKDMGILSSEGGVVRDIVYDSKGKIENKN